LFSCLNIKKEVLIADVKNKIPKMNNKVNFFFKFKNNFE